MIKCSICSYQCDNWYVSDWRPFLSHQFFSGSSVHWACPWPARSSPLHCTLAECGEPFWVITYKEHHTKMDMYMPVANAQMCTCRFVRINFAQSARKCEYLCVSICACHCCAGAAMLAHCAKKLFTLLDLCVSSLRRGHANLLCIVPILTDDPFRGSIIYLLNSVRRWKWLACAVSPAPIKGLDVQLKSLSVKIGRGQRRLACPLGAMLIFSRVF